MLLTTANTYQTQIDIIELQQRLEEMAHNIEEWKSEYHLERSFVKESILRAYEYQRSITILQELLDTNERVQSDPLLCQMFQAEIDTKQPICNTILYNLSPALLTYFEIQLLKLVKYQLQYNVKEVIYLEYCTDKSLNKWLSDQRMRINKFLEMKGGKMSKEQPIAFEILQVDIQLFERLNVKFRVAPIKKTFNDWMKELVTFKEQYGHIKVPQKMDDKVTSNPLGEWIKKLRREYTILERANALTIPPTIESKKLVPNLTPERIEQLSDMGMIWQIRYGRPRKGETRFRLRRPGFTRYGKPKAWIDNTINNNNTNNGNGNDTDYGATTDDQYQDNDDDEDEDNGNDNGNGKNYFDNNNSYNNNNNNNNLTATNNSSTKSYSRKKRNTNDTTTITATDTTIQPITTTTTTIPTPSPIKKKRRGDKNLINTTTQAAVSINDGISTLLNTANYYTNPDGTGTGFIIVPPTTFQQQQQQQQQQQLFLQQQPHQQQQFVFQAAAAAAAYNNNNSSRIGSTVPYLYNTATTTTTNTTTTTTTTTAIQVNPYAIIGIPAVTNTNTNANSTTKEDNDDKDDDIRDQIGEATYI